MIIFLNQWTDIFFSCPKHKSLKFNQKNCFTWVSNVQRLRREDLHQSSCCVSMVSDLKLNLRLLRASSAHTAPAALGFRLHRGTQVKRMWTLITETAGVSPWLPEQTSPVFIQPHDQCLHVNNRPSTASFNITWRKTPAVFPIIDSVHFKTFLLLLLSAEGNTWFPVHSH